MLQQMKKMCFCGCPFFRSLCGPNIKSWLRACSINIYTHQFSTITFAFSDVADEYYYRTVKVGQTVKFPCATKLPEDVDWARVVTPPMIGQKYIYLGNLGMHYNWRDRRFTKLDRNHSHTLVMSNVTLNDSAYYYRCVEDSGLGRRRFYYLTVEGADYFLTQCMHNLRRFHKSIF